MKERKEKWSAVEQVDPRPSQGGSCSDVDYDSSILIGSLAFTPHSLAAHKSYNPEHHRSWRGGSSRPGLLLP